MTIFCSIAGTTTIQHPPSTSFTTETNVRVQTLIWFAGKKMLHQLIHICGDYYSEEVIGVVVEVVVVFVLTLEAELEYPSFADPGGEDKRT